MGIRINGNEHKARTLAFRRERLRSLFGRAHKITDVVESQLVTLQPAIQRFYGIRRKLATALVAMLTIWLFMHVMFGANGMVVYREKRGEYRALKTELDGLQKQNEISVKQIDHLRSDPTAIEKIAREQFHYTRPKEFVLIRPTPAVPPAAPLNHAAQK